MEKYGADLMAKKKPKDKEVYDLWHKLDEDLLKEVMELYYERCKFKHAMAYMQYRRKDKKNDPT